MKCLFIKSRQKEKDIIIIQKEDFHHLHRVYRFQLGDFIEIKDDRWAYYCELKIKKKDQFIFYIQSKRKLIPPIINITLFQSIIKGEAFDSLLKKSTELGVSKIIPYLAERSVTQINKKNRNSKMKRWQKICLEASKQSGRDFIPTIAEVVTNLKGLSHPIDNGIIANENEKRKTLKSILPNMNIKKEISVLVGPEGGFTDVEIEYAHEIGFISCTISDYILRSETAGIYVISNLIFYFS